MLKRKSKTYGRNNYYQTSRTLPDKPTKARPGSKEKILVMQQRFQDGKRLYHPDDARLE